MPFVFVDPVARAVGCDFFDWDAVTFENAGHLPNSGNVFGCVGLAPADAVAKSVASLRGGFLESCSEPGEGFVELFSGGAGDFLPFEGQDGCPEDPLPGVIVSFMEVSNEADVFLTFPKDRDARV